VCSQSSFDSAQGDRITDGSRYIVPGSEVAGAETAKECWWKSEEAYSDD